MTPTVSYSISLCRLGVRALPSKVVNFKWACSLLKCQPYGKVLRSMSAHPGTRAFMQLPEESDLALFTAKAPQWV